MRLDEERKILKLAKEDFDNNSGKKSMRECISDAVLTSNSSCCRVFGIYFFEYIDYLLNKMGEV